MTSKFLEVKEAMSPWFLDEGFAGFYPPSGWLDLCLEIHEHVVAIAPNYRLAQVKEKFGRLCFYIDTSSVPPQYKEACRNYIAQKEKESETICQNCGRFGATLRNHSWVATLCATCDSSPGPPSGY